MQEHDSTPARTAAEGNEIQTIFASRLGAMDVRFVANNAKNGVARFSGVTLPGISIYKDEGMGTRNYVRSTSHIRQAPLDEYMYVLQLRAGSIVYQGGTQTVRTPGTATLMTPSRPFSGCISSESFSGKFSGLVANISGPIFRQHVPEVDCYMGHPLLMSAVSNNVNRFLLESSLSEAAALSEHDSRYLGLTLIDAIANATLCAIEQIRPGQRQQLSSLQRVHDAAKDFIAANLSDVCLSIEGIARHCGVSERYLHKAFSTFSGPVGAYIREARLQGCRRDILDPDRSDKTLLDIALDHGFASLTYFSRAYRARFDACPSQHRNVPSR